MKNIGSLTAKKWTSRSGESISETLVALLISAVALVMLAGTIAVSSSIITKGRDKLDAYYSEAEISDGVVRMSSQAGHINAVVIAEVSGDLSEQTVEIEYYMNEEAANTPVIAYRAYEP